MAKRVETPTLTTAQIIGRRLYDAREALEPKMTQTDAAFALARVIPWSKPHSSTISRIETGGSTNVYLVAALARIYGKTLADVAPEYVHHAQTMYHVLEDVIDVTDMPKRDRAWQHVSGSFALRLFDPDRPEVVVDIRDHVLAQMNQEDSLDLLALAG